MIIKWEIKIRIEKENFLIKQNKRQIESNMVSSL